MYTPVWGWSSTTSLSTDAVIHYQKVVDGAHELEGDVVVELENDAEANVMTEPEL
jgi:hypothetical protein